MKKLINYVALFSHLCVVFVCTTMVACCTKFEKPHCEEASSIVSNVQESQWLREVNYSLSLTARVNSDDQVVLKDYKYLGVIESQEAKEELIDDIFHKGALTVRCDSESKNVGFWTWDELNAYYKEENDEFIDKVCDLIKVGETEVLEMSWLYQGVMYKSKAIVDKTDGIIFDNIASYAIDYSNKSPQKINHRKERLSTRALDSLGMRDSLDSMSADSSRIFTFELSDVSNEIELVSGKVAWWYNICVESVFDDNGILISRRCNASSNSELGWSCEAEAETISGELYSSPYHEFAWAWAYGNDNTTITISFVGNGFSITGGMRKSKGTEIHSPRY